MIILLTSKDPKKFKKATKDFIEGFYRTCEIDGAVFN